MEHLRCLLFVDFCGALVGETLVVKVTHEILQEREASTGHGARLVVTCEQTTFRQYVITSLRYVITILRHTV